MKMSRMGSDGQDVSPGGVDIVMSVQAADTSVCGGAFGGNLQL